MIASLAYARGKLCRRDSVPLDDFVGVCNCGSMHHSKRTLSDSSLEFCRDHEPIDVSYQATQSTAILAELYSSMKEHRTSETL